MYSANIVLDSVNSVGDRLTTFEVTYPRIIHSEFLTHRLFSRNSASSRAIPNERLRQRIKNSPFIPVYWGKNQSGMQAYEELSYQQQEECERLWLEARNLMLEYSEKLSEQGLHKQICNRLVEPWMFITVIVTATEFENFFCLRTPRDEVEALELKPILKERGFDPEFPAQPEIQKIARSMWERYQTKTPRLLKYGEWHTPYITDEERDYLTIEKLLKISVARCARVSYLTHDGLRDLQKDLELFERLRTSGHWSPFEHVARAVDSHLKTGNFVGWWQYRKHFENEHSGRELETFNLLKA